ncbi:MAG: hypothetical protein AAB588_00690 [Patescibacteria group bacterium]
MGFHSDTKSWVACNNDQRRECKAHAVFVKLHGLPSDTQNLIREVKYQIAELKDEDGLDIEKLESLFPTLEKILKIKGAGGLNASHIKSLIKSRELSKIIKAIKNFRWSGGSSKTPNGKTAGEIGVSDELLDHLMEFTHAGDLLQSWLQTGDATWKRWVDGEIEKRARERDSLKSKNPQDPKIASLEMEMEKLRSDWRL